MPLGAIVVVAVVAIAISSLGLSIGPSWISGWDRGSSSGADAGAGNPPGSTSPVASVPMPAGACNPRTPTPSAVLLPVGAPSGPDPAGTELTASVEVAVLNTSLPVPGITISLPSLVATFPVASGGVLSIYLPATDLRPSGTGWAAPGVEHGALALGTAVVFLGNGSAILSSQKLAVLATAPYGQLYLGLRWQWSLLTPNGVDSSGPWTPLTPDSAWPSSVASEFLPAPWVGATALTPSPVPIGTNFSARLTGDLGGHYFYLELESPVTGKASQLQGFTAAPNASSVLASLPILNDDHYLTPGPYLVHVHDDCGAMLHSISVTAGLAASAQISITTSPAGCGSVSLNGTQYSNGSWATVAPSTTPYALGIGECSGVLPSLQLGGGLYSPSPDQLLVSSNGTLVVTYA
jgi:hypothetical protein